MRGGSCTAAPQRGAPIYSNSDRRALEPSRSVRDLCLLLSRLIQPPRPAGFLFRPGLLRHTRTKPTVILTNLFINDF